MIGHGYDFDRDFYTIHLENAMSGETFLNEITVEMDFASTISQEPNEGLYLGYSIMIEIGLSSHNNYTYLIRVENDGVQFVTTNFAKIGARKVFPCLDEPNFRAAYA